MSVGPCTRGESVPWLFLSFCCRHNPWSPLSRRHIAPGSASVVHGALSLCLFIRSPLAHVCLCVSSSCRHWSYWTKGPLYSDVTSSSLIILATAQILIRSHSELPEVHEFERTLFNPGQLISCETRLPLARRLPCSRPLWSDAFSTTRMWIPAKEWSVCHCIGRTSTVLWECRAGDICMEPWKTNRPLTLRQLWEEGVILEENTTVKYST